MATSPDMPTDGRIQRSERSKEAIVSAMLDLIGEGVLTPTAQQVAERAEVGVRTVFRHFSDMDTLLVAMNERLSDEAKSYFVNELQTGPAAERLQRLVERRAAAFEKLAPYLRASAIQRGRSAFLRAQHDTNIRTLRRDLHCWLRELESAPPELGAALEMALSFEAFDRLRMGQRLSARRTLAAIRATVLGLASQLEMD